MQNPNKLIGYKNILNNLVNLYEKNKLPNKILLTGKKGIGKSILAKHFTNYIYSKNEQYEYDIKNLKINEMNKSSILLETNSHPNVFNIYKKNDKKIIEISQIREMIQFQNYSSFNNKIKYILIDDLDCMSLNSSNALLKSTEEPNNNVYFILINSSENKIQNTLKSRCIEFKLFLDNVEVNKIVDEYFDENIYDSISNDFKIYYNSPSFLISLVNFSKENEIDYSNSKIEQFIFEIIKNKYYSENKFIAEYMNFFIELFFYKNINNSKKISFRIKEYFYTKFSQVKRYNLDSDAFFLEFEEKLLSE